MITQSYTITSNELQSKFSLQNNNCFLEHNVKDHSGVEINTLYNCGIGAALYYRKLQNHAMVMNEL